MFFSSNFWAWFWLSYSTVPIRSIFSWWRGGPSCFVRADSINFWISLLAQGIIQYATKTQTLTTAIRGLQIEAISPFHFFFSYQFSKSSVKWSLISEFSENSYAKVVNQCRALVMVLSGGSVVGNECTALDINNYTDSTLCCQHHV